ncbi:MAG TPA: ABC transporter permease [Acidobacteriaceae bacterium]
MLLAFAGAAAVLAFFGPQRPLYAIQVASDSGGPAVSMPVYEALTRNPRLFSNVVAYARTRNITASARGRTALVTGEMVSGNYFSVLGVKIRVGAMFNAEDVRRDMPVVVLSLDLWTKLFHRDPGAVGEPVYLDGTPFAVFGVTREGFSGVDSGHPAEFWIPLESGALAGGLGRVNPVGGARLMTRLSRGINPEAAAAEASRIAAAALPHGHPRLILVPIKPATGTR